MKAINILFSSFGYVNGQGYQRTYKLAVELAKLGHNVTYLTTQKSPNGRFPYYIESQGNLKVVAFFDFFPLKLKKLGLSPISVISKAIYAISKKYDITYADTGHRLSGGLPCWLQKMFYGTKYLAEWWDYYGKGGQFENKQVLWRCTYGFIDNWLEVKDKKIADGVVALSEFTKIRAEANGVNTENIAVINGGADIDQIHYVSDKRFRPQYGLNDTDFVIVMTGVVGEKDFGPLLSNLPRLNKTEKIRLVTTGVKLDKSFISKYHLDNTLLQFGWTPYPDYYKVLSLADCFFLYQNPDDTNRAKWPNKIGDYLSAGRVILTNPINDVSKLLQEKEHAIISFEPNAESIYECINQVILKKNELTKVGQKNRVLAEKHSWKSKALELEAFLFKVIEHTQ